MSERKDIDTELKEVADKLQKCESNLERLEMGSEAWLVLKKESVLLQERLNRLEAESKASTDAKPQNKAMGAADEQDGGGAEKDAEEKDAEEKDDEEKDDEEKDAEDVSPEELLDLFGVDIDDEDDSMVTKFIKDVAKSMIPTTTQIGDYLSKEKNDKEAVSRHELLQLAISMNSIDISRRAKALGRRFSFTAEHCGEPSCKAMHYGLDAYCRIHMEGHESVVPRDNPKLTKLKSDFEKLRSEVQPPAAADAPRVDPADGEAGPVSAAEEGQAAGPGPTTEGEEGPTEQSMTDVLIADSNLNNSSSAQEEATEAKDVPASPKAPKLSDEQLQLAQELEKMDLRQEMIIEAEVLDTACIKFDTADRAVELFGPDDESFSRDQLALLLLQFEELDVNKDGTISSEDVHLLIEMLDDQWVTRVPVAADRTHKIAEWMRNSHYDGKESMSFRDYVLSLKLFRERSKIVAEDLVKTAFWDLRACVLIRPSHRIHGWALKRGYMLVWEDLNSWKRRFFVTSPEHELKYYDKEVLDGEEDDPEKKMKGSFSLRDVLAVDFSPKTKVKQSNLKGMGIKQEDQVVFQVLVKSGRRYTMAADKDVAIKWVSQFQWYMASSRKLREWQEEWGSGQSNSLTIRDWINAAAVIVKIGFNKRLKKTAKMAAETAEKVAKSSWFRGADAVKRQYMKQFKKAMERNKITDRDKLYLRVVGLTLENAESASGVVVAAIETWNVCKGSLKALDLRFTGGLIGGGISLAINTTVKSLAVHNFARTIENRIQSNRYGIVWRSSGAERACNVCAVPFVSISLRKTKRKHHCRTCGYVVCQACSGNSIYMEITKKFERICMSCLENGPPDPAIAMLMNVERLPPPSPPAEEVKGDEV